MLFSTWQFAVFFIVFSIAYFAVRERYQLLVIILGSTFFYGWWKPEYVLLPYVLSLIAYGGAIWVAGADERTRSARTAIVLAVLFLPLAVFKYADFLWLNL